MTRTLLLIGLLVLNLDIAAQEHWTLDSCIQHAYQHSLEIKDHDLLATQAQFEEKAAQMALWPTLNARIGQTFRFGRSVDPLTYEFTTNNSLGSSFSLSSEASVFEGGQKLRRKQWAALNLQKSLIDKELAKQNLSIQITQLYLEISYYHGLLKMGQEWLSISEQQLVQTQQLVDAGSLTQVDYLEIKAQMISEEADLVDIELQWKEKRRALAFLINYQDPDKFNIQALQQKTFEKVSLPLFDLAYEDAQLNSPGLKSSQLQIEMYQKELSIAYGKRYPLFSLGGYVGTGYSDQIRDLANGNIMPFNQQLGYASTSSLQAVLRIPIFNNWRIQEEIAHANIALSRSLNSHDRVIQGLHQKLSSSLAEVQSYLKKAQALQQEVEAVQGIYKNAQEQIQVGSITALDYNRIKNKLSQAESELLQTKISYLFSLKIVDYYRGISR